MSCIAAFGEVMLRLCPPGKKRFAQSFPGSIEATFNYNGKDLVISVPSVPYARNYKTNIIGTLFTGPAKFNVVVVPGFVDTFEEEIINQ